MAYKQVTIEDTRLIFRNFAGDKKKFNKEGDRNFEVVLTDEAAEAMDKDDWFVKTYEPNDRYDELLHTVKVRIGENDEPPVYVIGEDKKPIKLNKGQFKRVDRYNIISVDVTFHQAKGTFEYDGREYHSAYLDKIYINILEDYLDKKYGVYADMPDPENGE